MGNEIDIRRMQIANRWKTGTKVALTAGAVAIVAPVTYLVVQGIVGLAAAGALGLAVMAVAPAAANKAANLRLKLIKMEAVTNPIETMENSLLKDQEQLRLYLEGLKRFSAALASVEAKAAEAIRKYPGRAGALESRIDTLRQTLKKRENDYARANDALREKRAAVEEARHMWEIGHAMQQTAQAAGNIDGDLMEKIKMDVAFDAVDQKVNKAFAALEYEVLAAGSGDKEVVL